MFVPFSCGAVLVREGGRVLRDSFDMTPEYLSEDRGGADVEFDFFRYGQMGTRRFNSLKLWMAIKFMGREGYARTVERQIELTEYLASKIDALSNFERVGPVETAVCCFRHKSGSDLVQQQLQQKIEREGKVWFTSTILHGRRALRVNINSFLTEQDHVDYLVTQIEKAGAEL
jgi:aromatic-L-amino-acid decarboxylase